MTHLIKHFFLILIALLSLSVYAQAQELTPSAVSMADVAQAKVPLSLSSAILYTLEDSPDVRMALSREEQADANIQKVRAGFYPLIDLNANTGREYNEPATGVASGGHSNGSHDFSFTLSQLLYDWGRTQTNYQRQKQLAESSRLDTQSRIENVMNDTIEAYLDTLEFQENLKVQTDFVGRLRELVNTVSQTFQAGASSKTMVDYANSRLASAENENNTLRANLNDSISNLEYLTGPMPPFEVSTPDDLDPSRVELDKYLAVTEKQNTGYLLNASDLKALNDRLAVTKKAFFPKIQLNANYDEKNNDGGKSLRDDEAQAMVNLTFRLYDGGERESEVKLARAQVKENEINQEKIVQDLRRMVKQFYNQIVSAQEARKQILKEIDSSEALQALNRQNFEQGSINIIELIEGEERLNSARTRLNTLKSDLYLNAYKLLITAGMLNQNFFCGSCTPETQQVSREPVEASGSMLSPIASLID